MNRPTYASAFTPALEANRTKIACHAFERALRDAMQDFERFADCDRAFDGGEWSDETIDRNRDRIEHDLAARVAARFGMTADELGFAFREWGETTTAHFFSANERRENAAFVAARTRLAP